MSNIIVTVVLTGKNLEPRGYMYTRTGYFKQDTPLMRIIDSANNYSLKDHYCNSIQDIEPMLRNIYDTIPPNYGDCSE